MKAFGEVNLVLCLLYPYRGGGIVLLTEQVVSNEKVQEIVHNERPSNRKVIGVTGDAVYDFSICGP